MITSEVATGPSTVESASRAVPQEDAGDEVLDTGSFEFMSVSLLFLVRGEECGVLLLTILFHVFYS